MTTTHTPGTLVQDPRRAALRSTVVMKFVMAATGLFMIAFLVAHMYGNFKVFGGQTTFDAYAEHLRTLGEPILPRGGFLWISRTGLSAAVLLHAYSAVYLWKRDRAAATVRGTSRYETSQNRTGVQRSYASFTLRWGGIVLIAFIVFHLLSLSSNNTIHPGGASDSPYIRLVNGFNQWPVVVGYTIAMLALGLHIRHGFWSAATTLGGNRSPARRRNLNLGATILALILTIGFLLPAYAVVFGWVDYTS